MNKAIKVVLVDDDVDYLASMQPLLEHHGFNVSCYTTFAMMVDQLSKDAPDILVLDITTPEGSVFDHLPKLRAERNYGLILVSGHDTIEYRIEGVEKGADVYLSKPVDVRELKAHLHSLHERLEPLKTSAVWRLTVQSLELCTPDGDQVQLTQKECDFLALLMAAGGGAVYKNDILNILGRADLLAAEGGLHVFFSRLRKKVSQKNITLPVRALRNVGYCFYETADVCHKSICPDRTH